MENCNVECRDGKVVITIDPAKRFGLSTSQKSVKVASTGGFVEVPGCDGLQLNLNAILPATKK